MKTALFIHSFQGCNDRLKRHWSFLKHSGLDMFGVGRTNSICDWPEPIPTRDIGLDAYMVGANLPLRMVKTFEWFLDDARFSSYTHAMIVECDSIFLGKPPEIDVYVGGTYSGMWPDPECKGGGHPYYHCPWWASREFMEVFVPLGYCAIAQGMIGGGSPDIFLGKVCREHGIAVFHLDGTFSKNTIDIPDHQRLVRHQIRENMLWFVHGVKTLEQLQFITGEVNA